MFAVVGALMLLSCTEQPDAIVVSANETADAVPSGVAGSGTDTATGTDTDSDTDTDTDTDTATGTDTDTDTGAEVVGGSGAGIDGSPLRTPLGGTRATAPPPTMWAIEADSFDLVEASSESGSVVERIGGWGADSAAESVQPQALVSVEASVNGLLWVDDCCEPGAGNVYALDGTETIELPTSDVPRRVGFGPEVSPDGSWVATSNVVGVFVDADIPNDTVIDITSMVQALDVDDGTGLEAIAWLSNDVVVVKASRGTTTTLVYVNVSASAPVLAADPVEVTGLVVSADVNADGFLVLAVVAPDDAQARIGRVIDPADGTVTAEFSLPPLTDQIDYDPTGAYLLISTDDGKVSWQGNGSSGTIPGEFYGASW